LYVLRGDTHIGELVLRVGSRSFVLDARPSDAIALALRTGAPVQLAKFLLDEVGEDAEPYWALFAGALGKFFPR
jgi:bifunctional DNase/RNase